MSMEQISEDGPNDTLQIRLVRDSDSGEWFAEQIDINRGDVHHRIGFRNNLPLAQAFVPQFLGELQPYLPDGPAKGVMADSSALIEIPGLVLGGIRVIAQSVVTGIQSLTIRFIRALGALQAVLLPKYRTETDMFAKLEGAAAHTLLSLLHPALDLADVGPPTTLSRNVMEQVAERLEVLARNRNEIGFFAVLLQRYLRNAPDLDLAARQIAAQTNAIGRY
ncbi:MULTISPECIES: hypothetical protein [Maritimibacter]|jgi:hypothetical protein|uniref:hypothetical protein n=1 Tax=Maritimibacter TaxID=404235 RepID=UPI00030260D5|nr:MULTISPECIES: hypothetical protein [Maritimibacter]MBL6427572.1 hypothetical protein [Maritimibacter sp.]TYP84442.1 hypothetical protein BD830_102535 [Maritimibacter alkaliphilus HTCC2654]